VKIASSTFLKPSPGFRTRTLSKANESAALFPKFHYLPSLGLGVGANIDNNSKVRHDTIRRIQQHRAKCSDSDRLGSD
jgi:hypothetical protein